MEQTQFEEGKIVASADMFPFDPGHRSPTEPHKVRVTILSGSDFRTPHINIGGVYPNRAEAMTKLREVRAALNVLCIPWHGGPPSELVPVDAHEVAPQL